MRFLILGALEVRADDGSVVAINGPRLRGVLTVLLLSANEPVSAERVALALWGEDAPAEARKTVHVYVSRLRKALGDPGLIVTSPGGYTLRVGPGELDAAEFEALASDGRRALAAGSPARAAALLRQAQGLWRGPALSDLAFEPFARVEVARLEEQRLAVFEWRVEADLAAGRHAEVVAELQRLATEHPTREQLAALLMLALYRCGRQSDALAAYQDARRALVSEIGVEPGPQLRERQEAVLRHDAALARRGRAELPLELDTSTAPPLVGRDDALTWLRSRWAGACGGSGGVVMLVGEHGAGKTRIAAELAGDADRGGARVLYASGRQPQRDVLGGVREAQNASGPALLVVDDVDVSNIHLARELDAANTALSRLPLLIVVCVERLHTAAGLRHDGALTLEPLDENAVRAITSYYAPGVKAADVPADWLLAASGGLPRAVHQLAGEWARREAASRVTAVAGRAKIEHAERRTLHDELVDGVVDLQDARERILPTSEQERLTECPFKGLASYEASDAEYFYGRERLIAELVARLVGPALLALVGPSGSGKSSVVRAGLLPALASGALPGSEEWRQVVLRPGVHPLRELRNALSGGDDAEGRVVLAVDQFEETFTYCADASERSEFVSTLIDATQTAGSRCLVVLALRADYYGRCAAYPELAGLLVPPMRPTDLRRAVAGPCRRSALRIEPELVDALVGDVDREPGGLPLLSTSLLELWWRRDGRGLTLAAYEQTGGVAGAIARLAEDAFGELDRAYQTLARRVLMQLVGAVDDGSIERRRVDLDELGVDSDPNVARIVALLTERRLLTVNMGSVEFAHQAVIGEWPRLREWIAEDRAGLQIARTLTTSARDWERLGRDNGTLLRGARLTEALEWRETKQPALNDRAREFLAASEEARN
jgi:DNA-binding SARP family transcriptional activator/energy-coupling factor transporter ATP-binding protein EcfA2